MLRCAVLWVSFFLVPTVFASAQNNLYDNGPTDGQDMAWPISGGFATSDAFTLSSNSAVDGLTFIAWLNSSDDLSSAEVTITSDELGGTTYFDQVVNFTQSGCITNRHDFKVCTENGAFVPVNLNAGTYWLNLENARTNALNEPVFWDQNSGPSLASEIDIGSIPSESFTLLGSQGTSTGTSPEPGGILLFGSGILELGWVLRRRLC